MITGALPFEWAVQDDQIYALLISEKYEDFWSLFKSLADVSPQAKDLIQNMLKYDPKERFRLNQIECHDWIEMNTEIEEVHKEDTKQRCKRSTKTKTIKKKRGALKTGDSGGTDPYSITEEDFTISEEEY